MAKPQPESQFDLIGYREYHEIEDALLDLPASALTVGELKDVLRITAEVAVSRFGAERGDYDALRYIMERAKERQATP
jgi:hypothetical protein